MEPNITHRLEVEGIMSHYNLRDLIITTTYIFHSKILQCLPDIFLLDPMASSLNALFVVDPTKQISLIEKDVW